MERARGVSILVGLSALLLVAVFAVAYLAPKEQPQGYHRFADTESLGFVRNATNVLSNATFLAVGIFGLTVVLSGRVEGGFADSWERRPWAFFFAAIALTAFGSAYYHWAPSDATLFWDRLPMTVAFTSLVTGVLADRVDPHLARRIFLPLIATGLGSILAWRLFGDLRPYIALQVASFLVVLVATLFIRSRYQDGGWMLGLFVGYAAALLFEHLDHEVKAAFGVSGGHPLKHLAAAMGVLFVIVMLKRRTAPPEEPRIS